MSEGMGTDAPKLQNSVKFAKKNGTEEHITCSLSCYKSHHVGEDPKYSTIGQIYGVSGPAGVTR